VLAKLTAVAFLTVEVLSISELLKEKLCPRYDAIIDVSEVLGDLSASSKESSSDSCTVDSSGAQLELEERQLHALLVPGGVCVCCRTTCPSPSTAPVTPGHLWSSVEGVNLSPATSSALPSSLGCGVLTRAAVCCNTTAALYWAETEPGSVQERPLERNLLEAITVTPTVAQRPTPTTT
jgi:hypothetical protein